MAVEGGVEGLLRADVQRVIDTLLKPGEVDGWEFRWVETDWLAVELQACGEVHVGFVSHAGTTHQLDTFADGVEDFIAESSFAWGQQRLLQNRRWETPLPSVAG